MELFSAIGLAVLCMLVALIIGVVIYFIEEYQKDSPGKIKWYNSVCCYQHSNVNSNWHRVETLSRTKKVYLSSPYAKYSAYQQYKSIKIIDSGKITDVDPMYLFDEMPRS